MKNKLQRFVDQLEIENLKKAYPAAKGTDGGLIENTEQSFLNAKSLVSFASEVNEQQRKDVLNSVLLAQLAASKKFQDEAQVKEWYGDFITTLNKIGWTVENREFSNFSSTSNLFEIENAIIDILTTAFGGTFIVIIKKTLDSIKSLSDSNGKIKAFEKNTHSLKKGAFQIGVASVSNGAVALQVGTFFLDSKNEIKKILFFKSSKDSTTLDYCSSKATLNEEVYGTIRTAVVDKLGVAMRDYISEIEI